MRTLRRYLKPVVLLLVQGLFSLADALMGFVADKSGDDSAGVEAEITPADVEAALTVVCVRASVELSGFPPEVADVFLAAKVSPAAVDRMLVAALQRVQ